MPSVGREQRLRDRSSSRRPRCRAGDARGARSRSDPRPGRAGRSSPSTLRRGRVEDGVDRIRPVRRGQDRVGRVTVEELAALLTPAAALGARGRRGRAAQTPARVEEQRRAMEARASTRRPRCRSCVSSPSPSLQPPVAKSYSGRWRRLRPRNQSNARWARAPCSGSPVTANAASSASTNAEASSGCSSPLPGAGSSRLAAAVAGQPQRAVGEAGLVAEPAKRLEAGLASGRSRPSATPPTISACGSRALS